MPEHSIFGANPYPGTLGLFTDGTPNILLGNGFYTFTAGAAGWPCVGGRLYLPAGVAQVDPVPIGMWPYAGAGNGPDLSTEPLAEGVIATPVEGWNEVHWTPVEVTPGVPFWISYDLGGGRYLAATDLGTDFIQASDGATVVLGEQNMSGLGARAYFRIGAEGTTAGGGNGYGVDVIVDEGASAGNDVTGTASAVLPITGTANGVRGVRASGGATLPLVGSATGVRGVRGTATATLGLIGTAVGRRGVRGTASAVLPIVGVARGPVVETPTPPGRTVREPAEARVVVEPAESRIAVEV